MGKSADNAARTTGARMGDPYRYFLKKFLWVAVIYLGVMAEIGFLRGSGVL